MLYYSTISNILSKKKSTVLVGKPWQHTESYNKVCGGSVLLWIMWIAAFLIFGNDEWQFHIFHQTCQFSLVKFLVFWSDVVRKRTKNYGGRTKDQALDSKKSSVFLHTYMSLYTSCHLGS